MIKIIETELVMDNEKGKKYNFRFSQKIFNMCYDVIIFYIMKSLWIG